MFQNIPINNCFPIEHIHGLKNGTLASDFAAFYFDNCLFKPGTQSLCGWVSPRIWRTPSLWTWNRVGGSTQHTWFIFIFIFFFFFLLFFFSLCSWIYMYVCNDSGMWVWMNQRMYSFFTTLLSLSPTRKRTLWSFGWQEAQAALLSLLSFMK